MPKEFPKLRKPYAAQACGICRAKKSKCDGIKPVCGSCAAAGRNDECAWGRDAAPGRKPRTEAHFEALRKRADSLQAYVDLLEGIVAKCTCQDVSTHLQFRPQDPEASTIVTSDELWEDYAGLESDEEITRELTVPTERLKLDQDLGTLMLHGLTSSAHFTNKHPREVLSTLQVAEKRPDTTYVLLVDGVDASGADLQIDWSRYLPPEVPLDRREHDKILDLSFKFLTMWSLRVVPSLFLRDMYRALSFPRSEPCPATPHYSPMLHNALLCVSVIFSDDPCWRNPAMREHFANAATARMKDECRRPNISFVEALNLLASYYSDKGDRILADLHVGMCSRVSQSLGLGVDSKAWVKAGLLTNDEMVNRNRAHWTVFCMDVCWALYFTRDFCWPPLGRHTTPMPFVDAKADQIPWYHASANIPPQPNYLYLTFFETSSLLMIAHKIIDVVNSLQTSGGAVQDLVKVEEKVSRIDLELNNWKSRLPLQLDITPANRVESTPQRLMLHCLYSLCNILLHRPFSTRRARTIQHSYREVDHIKLCKRAAENILELLGTWSSLYSLRYCPPTILQVIYSAASIFLLLALQATANRRIAQGSLRTALTQVEQCLSFLDEMGKSWECAARTRDMLRGVLDARLRPIIVRRLEQKGGVEDLPGLVIPLGAPADSGGVATNVRAESGVGGVLPPSDMWMYGDNHSPQPALGDAGSEWSRISMEFLAQLEGDVSSCTREAASSDFDASGFLPTFGSFGNPEFWDQAVFNSAPFEYDDTPQYNP